MLQPPSIDDLLALPWVELPAGGTNTLGTHRVHTFVDGRCIDIVRLHPDTTYQRHVHDGVDSVLHFLRGFGHIIIDGKPWPYNAGSQVSVPRGTPHGFLTGRDPTIFFSFQSGQIYDPATGKTDVRYL